MHWNPSVELYQLEPLCARQLRHALTYEISRGDDDLEEEDRGGEIPERRVHEKGEGMEICVKRGDGEEGAEDEDHLLSEARR